VAANTYPSGQPYVVMPAMTYEQQIIQRQRQREQFNANLRHNFPVKYMFFNGFLLLFVGIVCIALQIALITFQAPFYYLVNGLWGGGACVFLSLFYAVFSK
jgi:hypothetical protein